MFNVEQEFKFFYISFSNNPLKWKGIHKKSRSSSGNCKVSIRELFASQKYGHRSEFPHCSQKTLFICMGQCTSMGHSKAVADMYIKFYLRHCWCICSSSDYLHTSGDKRILSINKNMLTSSLQFVPSTKCVAAIGQDYSSSIVTKTMWEFYH